MVGTDLKSTAYAMKDFLTQDPRFTWVQTLSEPNREEMVFAHAKEGILVQLDLRRPSASLFISNGVSRVVLVALCEAMLDLEMFELMLASFIKAKKNNR